MLKPCEISMKSSIMLLGLAGCVSAAAVLPAAPRGDWKLLPRDETWEGDGEWDVRVFYGGGGAY